MTLDMIEAFTQFGVAGLMGVLWVWERLMSGRRERQLSDAHERIMQQRDHLRVLVRLVQRNTKMIERFDRTQSHLCKLIDRVENEMKNKAV